MRRKLAAFLAASSLIFGVVNVAAADTVNVIATSLGGNNRVVNVTVGQSVDVFFWVENGPSGGLSECDATGGSPAVLRYESLPAGVSVSPASISITGCGTDFKKSFRFTSTTTGTKAISAVSVSDLVGNYNRTGSTFDLIVAAPADTTPPVVSVPANVTTEATSGAGAPVTYAASATDAVDGAITPTCVPASGSTFALGTTTVACSATDRAGNTGQASFTVTVRDTTRPVVSSLPADQSLTATGPDGATATWTAPTASDAVDGTITPTCAPTSGSSFALGATTVTCSATDAAGNTGTGSFTVTVSDRSAPILSGLPGDITTEATSASGATVEWTRPTASDDVDLDVAVSCTPASGATFAIGTTTVRCSATDAAGNTADGAFDVTVGDGTAPVLSGLPEDITTEATGPSGATVAWTEPTASDNVDGTVAVTCTAAPGTTYALGRTTVTCSATDDAGNTVSDSFTVIVRDTTAPGLSLPAGLTTEATGPGGATVAYAPTASDLVDGVVPVTCDPAPGSTFTLGTTTVTCTATDAAGNPASETFTVVVQDTTAPAFTDEPEPVIAEATAASGAPVTFAAPIADDVVGGSIRATCDPAPGSTFPLGATTVTCTATDAAGNAATERFEVTVQDTTAPAFADQPGPVIAEATAASGAPVTFAAPVAGDAVGGSIEATCDPAPGSTFPLGATTVTCTATDAAGNAATERFEVTVQDTTAPVLPAALDLPTAEATGPAGAPVSWSPRVAVDAVDGALAMACDPASGATFALGATTVTCSVTDAAGNTASEVFTARVQDTTGPVLSGTPANQTVVATGSRGAVVDYTAPTASDAVSGSWAASCSTASGSTFALGATTVTCSATDGAGNPATPTSFTVSVQYASSGILQPINTSGNRSGFKLNSTIPVKIQLTGASAGVTDAQLNIRVTKQGNGIDPDTLIEVTSTSAATSGSLLRHDATSGQYLYNLATRPLGVGTFKIEVLSGTHVLSEATISIVR